MGRRGPQKTPTKILAMRGSWRAKTRQNEPEPGPGRPQCPRSLPKEGKAEWRRITAYLAKMGMLATCDRVAIAGYCSAWAQHDCADTECKKTGYWYVTPNGVQMQTAAAIILKSARGDMLRYLREFGLSLASRASVGTSTKTKVDKEKAAYFEIS